jgi:nitrate reductase assembly molybdenum cofactor insertion protein NarJ
VRSSHALGDRLDDEVTGLLIAAQEWHLIGRLLERPRPEWREDVRRLADGVADPELREAARLAATASEGRYLAALAPSGVVSPREVAHCGMRDPGQLLAEIEACYRAFRFTPATEDTMDHLAVEVSFIAYLRLKEAYARARGAREAAAITEDAARRFSEDHVRSMAEPIAHRLGDSAEPYLAQAARLLADRVGSAPPVTGRKVVWLEDESWACGTDDPAPRGGG